MDMWAACYHARFGGPGSAPDAIKVAAEGVNTRSGVSGVSTTHSASGTYIHGARNGACFALGRRPVHLTGGSMKKGSIGAVLMAACFTASGATAAPVVFSKTTG